MKALSGLDASFLYLETPRMPMHIGSMAIIEGTINFEDFKTYIEQRLHQVERLQQKVVFVPLGLDRPYWVQDPNFDLDRHFPAPSMSGSSKSAVKKNTVFDRKPAAQIATDNFLAFPPPSASKKVDGMDQVDGMKQSLGQAKYKELKRKTKDFALGSLDPESYVTAIVSLFDGGIKNPSLWEYIPNLILSIVRVGFKDRFHFLIFTN